MKNVSNHLKENDTENHTHVMEKMSPHFQARLAVYPNYDILLDRHCFPIVLPNQWTCAMSRRFPVIHHQVQKPYAAACTALRIPSS